MKTVRPGLGRGERAPDFVLPLENNTPTRFYAIAGGQPTILAFCTSEKITEIERFCKRLHEISTSDIPVVVVKRAKPGSTPADDVPDERLFPVFTDTQRLVQKGYRLEERSETVVFALDPNLRVLDSFFLDDPDNDATMVRPTLEAALPRVEASRISVQAPVLLIPNALDPKFCEELIGIWRDRGSEETGVEQSRDGRREDTISHEHKRRRDHVVMDKDLLKRLTIAVGRRVMPEVRKAFAFKATRFEGFKIACYDAETGGFFHAHRDNLSPSTAHRRFALTLNLNDDYEGGFLRFPEYGPHLYRPETGGAVVFSCSNLHEVTNVTKGRRFALLSFLFSEGDVRTSQPN